MKKLIIILGVVGTSLSAVLVRFAEAAADVASLDKEPKMEGRSMSIFLSPKAGK